MVGILHFQEPSSENVEDTLLSFGTGGYFQCNIYNLFYKQRIDRAYDLDLKEMIINNKEGITIYKKNTGLVKRTGNIEL